MRLQHERNHLVAAVYSSSGLPMFIIVRRGPWPVPVTRPGRNESTAAPPERPGRLVAGLLRACAGAL